MSPRPARAGDVIERRLMAQPGPSVMSVFAPHALFTGGAYVERRTIRRTGGLSGESIGVEGLSATFTDVLVRVQYLYAVAQTERLTRQKRLLR